MIFLLANSDLSATLLVPANVTRSHIVSDFKTRTEEPLRVVRKPRLRPVSRDAICSEMTLDTHDCRLLRFHVCLSTIF